MPPETNAIRERDAEKHRARRARNGGRAAMKGPPWRIRPGRKPPGWGTDGARMRHGRRPASDRFAARTSGRLPLSSGTRLKC